MVKHVEGVGTELDLNRTLCAQLETLLEREIVVGDARTVEEVVPGLQTDRARRADGCRCDRRRIASWRERRSKRPCIQAMIRIAVDISARSADDRYAGSLRIGTRNVLVADAVDAEARAERRTG